ncbi:mannosyltransferase family protein [Catenuloplanes atrovinosus]|uniref:Integral membrane protein n=1 Tax=Catenuloplanes atrovinosus TaxID=137266 RepID=A0AAE3YUN1_9ACTN|nr:mannosyltransferase family protein [Catenuloplanes atrovinosus]MDR7279487.1 hypothetical protein [Catenuloplanes atrovinosus]
MPAETPTKSPADGEKAGAAQAEKTSAAQPTAPGRSWWPAILVGGAVWAASYLAWVVVTLFSQYSRPRENPISVIDLMRGWWRYDATVFTRIAEHGYDTQPSDPAFFPLYSLLIRGADLVLPGGAKFVAIVVSAAAMFAMYTLLYRLTEVEFGPAVAVRTCWAMAAWPVAFFLGVGYNGSLFIALMLGTVYALRRGHWWVAGVLGAFATATRSVGVLLALAFAYEYLRRHGFRWRWNVLAAGLMPTGLLAFMGYLWWRFGDPLLFLEAQKPWGRELDWPWVGIVRAVELISSRPLVENGALHSLLDLASVLAMLLLLTLCFAGPWRMRRDQYVLPLLGVALLLFAISFPAGPHRNQPLMSAPRFALEVFPAFMLLGHLRIPAHIYATAALMLQGLLFAHFTRGGWVG